MERVFLFRGKRIDNGKWITGCMMQHGFETPYIFETGTHAAAVEPSTVGQCLGFEDESGKLIFEGDIIQRDITNETIVGDVVWTDVGITGFMLKVTRKDHYSFFSMGRGKFDDDIGDKCNDKIIGNIHDNPELMEVLK